MPVGRCPRRFLSAITCALALTVSACGSGNGPDADPGTTTIKLLDYPGSNASWLGYIAQRKGFFEENDLNVEFTSLPAGAQATNALAGGSLDVAVIDMNNAAPLLSKGVDLKLLVNGFTNYWVMVGEKSLKDGDLGGAVEQLKGKTIDVPSLGGSGGRMVQMIATSYGHPADALELAADPTNAGFEAGHAQAAMTDAVGACRLDASGYPELMNFVDPPEPASSYPPGVQSLVGLAGLGFWTKASWAEDNAEAAKGFRAAIESTVKWAKDPAHLAELARMMRSSDYNVPSLSDPQWTSCVERISGTFRTWFSTEDASRWQRIVKELGIASSLPPTSEWFASTLPTSEAEADHEVGG